MEAILHTKLPEESSRKILNLELQKPTFFLLKGDSVIG